jgi:hypothetical protein
VTLLSKSGSSYKMDVDSVMLSVNGSASIQNRQNKLEIDELIKRTPPIRIVSLKDIVIARGKTLYFWGNSALMRPACRSVLSFSGANTASWRATSGCT